MPFGPREWKTGPPFVVTAGLAIVALSVVGLFEFGPPHSLIGWCLLPVGGLGLLAAEAVVELLAGGVLFARGLSLPSSWPPGQPQLSLGPRSIRRRKRRRAGGLPFSAQQFR